MGIPDQAGDVIQQDVMDGKTSRTTWARRTSGAAGPASRTWYATGAVQTDETSESVVEFVREQRGLAGARPIDAKELENARPGLLRSYAAGFDTNLDVTERIKDAVVEALALRMVDRAHDIDGIVSAERAEDRCATATHDNDPSWFGLQAASCQRD